MQRQALNSLAKSPELINFMSKIGFFAVFRRKYIRTEAFTVSHHLFGVGGIFVLH